MPFEGMVKLTDEDIKWMVRRVSSGFFTVKKAAQIYGVTERRIQQKTKMYRDTGVVPTLNPKSRLKTYLRDDQRL